MKYLKLFEEYNDEIIVPKEFRELKEIALKFDNADDFAKSLDLNNHGNYREESFLGERFLRLHRGYTLDEIEEYSYYEMDEEVTAYRTGDKPIVWGDYVYINYDDVKHTHDSGQGEEIYDLDITYDDLIYCTQGSGEFFYSPRHLRDWSGGERLQDFWNKVNGVVRIPQSDDIEVDSGDFKEKVIELINNTNEWEDFEANYYDLATKHNENPRQFDVEEMWYDMKN